MKAITQFRKELFQLAEQALEGQPVQFVYRGVVFTVTPDKKKSKLDKLVGQPVVATGSISNKPVKSSWLRWKSPGRKIGARLTERRLR